MTVQQAYTVELNEAGQQLLVKSPGVINQMGQRVDEYMDEQTQGRWTEREAAVSLKKVGQTGQCVMTFNPVAVQMLNTVLARRGYGVQELVQNGLKTAESWRPWNEERVAILGMQPVTAG